MALSRALADLLAVALGIGAAGLLLGLVAGLAPAALAAEAGADSSGADTSGTSGSDSTGTGADSLGAGGTETGPETEQGEATETRRAAAPRERFWVAHPTYRVNINKRQDVTNYDSKIGLTKDLSDKITLNLSGALATRENTTLNRSDATNTANAGLRYGLNENISFNMNYNTNLSAFSYDLKGGAPADLKKNEDLTISADLTKKLLDAVDVSLKAVAGSTANSFAAVSNNGRRQDLSASVSFAPSERFRASATYSGKRLFLDSEVDSGQGAVFRTEDKTFSENISVTMSYEMLPGVRLGLDASDGEDQRQHPDPNEKEQETEKRSNKSAALTTSFTALKRLTWDLAVRLNDSDSEYLIRSRSNRKTSSAELSGNAKIIAWRGANMTLGGARDVSRDEYVTADTGDNAHKSLSFKLSQDLGPKADANLTAISDLIRVAYDDKAANPKDRDRLSNRILVDFTYLPLGNVTTKLGGEYGDEQSIYVKGEASANNRTTTRYRVTGRYDVKTVRNITIGQTYEIGAVYSLYQFEEDNNALVRNSNVSTSFRVPVSPHLVLDLDHAYRYQDQGGYQEDSAGGHYGRSAANESNTFTITSAFSVKKVRFMLRQAYYVQDNWEYKAGKKVFRPKTWSTDISGRASFKYEFKERTSFSFSLEQNLKEGTNVAEATKQFWNIEMEASHVF